jgi:gamma-tubulin complex component 4
VRAHDSYLATLAVQTFRHVPAVRCALDAILEQCTALCALLEGAEDRGASASLGGGAGGAPYDASELERISASFHERSAFLLDFLRGAYGASGASPHLAQLLMRIDYNGFWSSRTAHTRRAVAA